MVKDVCTNIQSKIKNKWPPDPFALIQEVCQGYLFSMLLYIIMAEVLASFIDANKMIKGIQIGDHEIEIVNFADDTTIFLRDITCLDRIQVILKLYEDASSSKINFSKSQASANSIKILEVNFGNSVLDNSKWDKISEGIAKNPYLELRVTKIIVNQKIRPPRYLTSIWMIEQGILDIETQLRFNLKPLKIKWIQRSLNPTNALWKNLMLYQLNLILSYNQELALFR